MKRIVQSLSPAKIVGAGLIAGSVVVLAISIVVIVSSLQGEDADLPAEGSLESILEEDDRADGNYSLPGYSSQDGAPDTREPHGPAPVGLAIPQLGVDAPVIRLGLDADNIPLVPDSAGEVAWYDFSATPGMERNSVFSGHVDWQTRSGDPIPGVFYRLRELRIGNEIQVTLEDEEVLTYRVTGNVATDYNDPNVVRVMEPTVGDVITLITCGGSWIHDPSKSFGGVYSHRIVVRAELVSPLAAAELNNS